MFFVFNRSKIYSYMIALSTVTLLFIAAATLNDVTTSSLNSVETGTNVLESNIVKDNTIEENRIKRVIVNE